jgi:hypothetical protein
MLTRRAVLTRTAAAGAVLAAGPAQARRYPAPTRRRPVFGTELEYYRSDPAHLEARLDACVKAGLTTIQTYVPWNVHENTRGTLDFSGKTHPLLVHDHVDEYQIETPDQEIAAGGLPGRVVANTDLLGFVAACARRRLEVILRPGPFISDEWRNGGIPDWLLDAYPDMFQRGPHGSALEPGAPFDPPAETVVGGGPLFYFAGPSYASADYLRECTRWMTAFARAVAHLQRPHGPVVAMQVDDEICFYYRFGPFEVDYHPSMVKRFGAEPPTDWPAKGGTPGDLLPALRWQRFKAQQLAVFLRVLRNALHAGGTTVPVFHEMELQLSPPANLAALARAVDVLHPEFYLSTGAWSQPTLELCAAAVRACQRGRRDLIADEMSESDVFIRHLLLGEGISGFVGFGYTEGVPDDAVADMAVLGETLKLAGHRLAETHRVADTAIVWSPEQLYAPYGGQEYGFERDIRNVIERDAPALATLLIRAGLAFDLLDTDVARPHDYDAYRSVWLVAGDVLPRSAQHALVRYVRRGGRLICWPAPPTLDADYAPCTVLRDALFTQALGPRFAGDATVSVLGGDVPVWRDVQTYALDSRARAIASRAGVPCGYSIRRGRGHALLLGTWPVCDSVPGREGDVFDIEDTGGDPPTHEIVFNYSNQRRGGEFISGGTVATWDGTNVIPTADINTDTDAAGTPPSRPISIAHLRMARKLHGARPRCAVSDPRAQARLLSARGSRAQTVSLINRYEVDIEVVVRVGRRRLPTTGKIALPAGATLLLPLDWRLAPGLRIDQATVQPLAFAGRQLDVTSPRGGEVVVNGRRLTVAAGRQRLTIA